MDKLGIIGLGNMGESIVKALLQTGMKKESLLFAETKEERAKEIEKQYGLEHSSTVDKLTAASDYILLAIKPQDAADLLGAITPFLDKKKIIISIMAGVTTSKILALTAPDLKIIRIMPNICVKVGEGVMGITANPFVTAGEISTVEKAFAPLGRFVETSEGLMDAITALGGSGPAFFLLFLEAMIDAGVKTGLARDKAKLISMQVVKGTLKMLEEENIHPAVMKDMITSPAGTTIAGLSVLEERAFRAGIIGAVEKASQRSKELSS